MSSDIARVVTNLASLMSAKLQAKQDEKDGWGNCSVRELLEMLEGEVRELSVAYDNCDAEGVVEEVTDIANYCAMIVDNISVMQMSRAERDKLC